MLKTLLVYKGRVSRNVDITIKVALSKKKNRLFFCCNFIEFPLHLKCYKIIIQKEYFRTKSEIF